MKGQSNSRSTLHRLFGALASMMIVTGALAVSTLSASAGAAVAATKVVHGGILTDDVVGGSWPTLDPALPTAETSEFIYFASIYGTLFDVGTKGALVPDLATGWSKSVNGLTITIDLRKGLKFTDGTSLNATAVKWNITRDENPATDCLCQPFEAVIGSVTTPNPTTVVLHLNQRSSALITALVTSPGSFMVSPTAFAAEGTNYQSNPVGAGPFKVQSDVPNTTLDVVKNPGYWDAKGVPLSGVDFQTVGTGASAAAAVASNTAQFTSGITVTDVPTAKSLGDKVVVPPTIGWNFMHLNTNIAPFNNILAREALQYATDPGPIASSVTGGAVDQVMNAPGSSVFTGYKLKGAFTYNPTKAQALVQQLGGISFTFFTVSNTGTIPAEAQALVNEWAAVGIKATAVILPHTQSVTLMNEGADQAMLDSYGAYVDPLLNLETITFCNAAINHWYCNPVSDHLMQEMAVSYSLKAQANLFNEIEQQEIVTDHAYVPITTTPAFEAWSSSLHSLVPVGPVSVLLVKNFWLS